MKEQNDRWEKVIEHLERSRELSAQVETSARGIATIFKNIAEGTEDAGESPESWNYEAE